MKDVILIVGPGRSGTTFLYYLIKELGFDCGTYPEYFQGVKRGYLPNDGNIPYVVKGTGAVCNNLDKYVDIFELNIKHTIVAMRNIESCARSQTKKKKNRGIYKNLNDEELYTQLKAQELPRTVGNLFFHLTEKEIPFTLVKFPKSAINSKYCYNRLKKIFPLKGYNAFYNSWKKTVVEDRIRFGG